MTINQGTEVPITSPNARVDKYDPDSDQYLVHYDPVSDGGGDPASITKTL